MTSRLNAPKRATCPKGVSHTTFRRDVDLAGCGSEILDEQLLVIALGNPGIMRVERRYSGIVCATCGTDANVSLTNPAQ